MSDAQVGYKTLQHLVQRPVHTPRLYSIAGRQC